MSHLVKRLAKREYRRKERHQAEAMTNARDGLHEEVKRMISKSLCDQGWNPPDSALDVLAAEATDRILSHGLSALPDELEDRFVYIEAMADVIDRYKDERAQDSHVNFKVYRTGP